MKISAGCLMLFILSACGDAGEFTRYTFTAQSDGYVTLDLTGLGSSRALITPFIEGARSPITNFANARQGEEVHAYLAVTTNTQYVFEIAGYDTALRRRHQVAHEFDFTFHPLTDAFEPNDTPDTAWPLNTSTVEALLTAGYDRNGLGAEAFDDWYSVTAEGNSLTATVENVPDNLSAVLRVYDASDTERELAQVARKGVGTTVSVSAPTVPGQTYLVYVSCAWNGLALSGTGALPVNFSQPYRLTVAHEP